MKICKLLCVSALVINPLLAERVDYNFTGGTTGTFTWEVDGNWTIVGDNLDPSYESDFFPSRRGAAGNETTIDGDMAIITGLLSGDRVIETSGLLNLGRLQWTYQAPGDPEDPHFVDTIKLGGGVFVNSRAAMGLSNVNFSISNPTGDASLMVLDLNGFVFQGDRVGAGQPDLISSTPITIMTTAPGAELHVNNPSVHAGVVVKSGVTVQFLAGASALRGTWEDGSRVHWIGATGTRTMNLTDWTATGLYDYHISNSTASNSINTVTFNSTTLNRFLIRNDFVMDANDAETVTNKVRFRTADQELWIGGDFLDLVQSSEADSDFLAYTAISGSNLGMPGTVVFYGSPSEDRQVTISRNQTHASFRVGSDLPDSAEDQSFGAIRLGNDLTTSYAYNAEDDFIGGGLFQVRAESRVDFDEYSLTASEFEILQYDASLAPSLSFKVGADNSTARISVTEDDQLTLNRFVLDLIFEDGWVDGSNVVLFSFGGNLTGTPELLYADSGNPGFYYDDLQIIVGELVVTNVVIPEPGWMALGAALFLGGFIIRKKCRNLV